MYKFVTGRDQEEVSEKLARFLADNATQVITDKGVAKLGLAGGSSPKRAYELFSDIFNLWERTLIFPTDERYVPSEDRRSNYRMLRETLGERAKIYRVKTELPLRKACEDFNRALGMAGALDLVLLGLGADGHTASLFPCVPCEPCGENACTSRSPDGLERVSMSLGYINSCKKVAFIVVGEKKRRALEGLLKGEDIPAVRVKGEEDTLIFTDLLQEARSELQSKRSKH
ncbi:6-phosphogluconolactonase [Hydrogenivirga caldilitoris]|uniref:6-phosphogluconolactonase n=1 Tax=Hydrogenivirga caldilitoris TaxID=246264 RepID=A0A497XTG0_9AQUI|nr:6-phosphogluconolactonase [Hydrogenivirga caldilitoris]RLJ71450.1 6-phosphogluconolactonase [Hydrogenivirga caldilitoris]